MTRFLTAEEAKQMTRRRATREEINQINDAIIIACNEGKTSCTLDGSISQLAKRDLETGGFEVKCELDYYDSYTTIKWG